MTLNKVNTHRFVSNIVTILQYLEYSKKKRQLEHSKQAYGKQAGTFLNMTKAQFINSETYVKRPLKTRQNKNLKDKWYLNEGRKYCRMLQRAILGLENNVWSFGLEQQFEVFLRVAVSYRFYCIPKMIY